jgi:hypothetical protein
MQMILNKKNLSKVLLFFVVFVFVLSVIFNPLNASAAQQPNNLATASSQLNCGWTDMSGCVALIGYGAFFVPSNWLLSISGTLFDAMVAFSLSSDVMNQPFVMTAWETVRDVANMAFIFVLLYIAIATILGLGNYKKLLVNLVIVALIINFSAFFTKIVIDASNVLAVGIYNTIEAPPGSDIQSGGGITIIPESRISYVFVSGFNPQSIAGNGAYQDWKGNDGSVSSLFFIFLVAGIVQIVAAFILFAAGFLFLGRMVAFILLIIASPIAFVAFILPGAKGLFDKWLSSLTNQALVAPVFLFFMYVIAQIVQSNFLGSIFQKAGTSFLDLITSTVLAFSFLIITMMTALNVTKKLSGQAGSMATKFVGGGGLNAVARAGRGAGWVASHAANRMEKAGVGTGSGARAFAGRMMLKSTRGVADSSFDLRATRGFKAIAGATGTDFGTAKTGREVRRERREKDKEKKEESATRTRAAHNAQLGSATTAAAAGAVLSGLSPKNIAKLDPKVLARPEVAQHLDVAALNAMMNNKDLNLTNAQRQTIMREASGGPHGLAVNDWLTVGGGVGF